MLRKFLPSFYQGQNYYPDHFDDFNDIYKVSDYNQEEFTKNLRKWLVEDRRPVSIVNDDNFLQMIQGLDPKIFIPPYKNLFRKYGMAEEFEKYKMIEKRKGSKFVHRIARSNNYRSKSGEWNLGTKWEICKIKADSFYSFKMTIVVFILNIAESLNDDHVWSLWLYC